MNGLALAALLLAGASAVAPPPEVYAQVTVRERIIIRVPTRPPLPAPALHRRLAPPEPLRWKEKKAPECIPLKSLAGADLTRRDSIDLILRGGERIRARLERRCPALDFYAGFYVKPHKDGRICADRDSIRTRAGGQCEITAFRRLVPDR